MVPAGGTLPVGPDDELNSVLERMSAEDVEQFPVVGDGQFLGMVARDRMATFIQARTVAAR